MRNDDKSSQRSDAAALASQLRWYGAAAAAAGVLAVAPTADAQIVYTDVSPDVTLMGTGGLDDVYSVDFDGDGDPEIDMFESGAANYAAGFPEALIGPDQQNAIVGLAQFGYQYFLPLSAGAAISAGVVSTTAAFQFGPTFTYYNADPAGWVGAGDKFVGTRFSLNGVNHYGWVRVEMPAPGTLIIRDFAYESTPNTAITAGDTGVTACDIKFLASDLSYDAGTRRLAIDVTVRNNGASASGAALELDYNRDGGSPQGTRALGQGTLPAGAQVSRTINLPVPGSAPDGNYNFTLRLVDPATGADCGSYTETIAISAPRLSDAPSDVASDGSLFSEVAPIDLTVEAAAAPLASAVQHRDYNGAAVRGQAQASAAQVLSEVGANPFRGTTQLSLEVPSTQHVRVQVYDALGREVVVLHDDAVEAGTTHRLTFDATGLAAGVYIVRVTGETFSDAQTVTLMR